MDLMRFYDITLADLKIDMRELYILMGYNDHTPSQDILDMIDDIMSDLAVCCKPRCGYIIADGKLEGKDHIQINNLLFNPGHIITSALSKAEKFVLFTATVGHGFDEWFEKMKEEDDIVKSFVANSLGSILADATVEYLMNTLADTVSVEGMSISNNYSPGYCDWLLVEQQKIFSLFPEGVTGITLTDSSLMLPIKSVSGIVGIGRGMQKKAYSCSICNYTGCIMRKARTEHRAKNKTM